MEYVKVAGSRFGASCGAIRFTVAAMILCLNGSV